VQKIVDSCQIINNAKAGTLKDYFQDIIDNRITTYIDNSVLKEIKFKLDEDQSRLFHELYNDCVLRKLVVSSQKKYRLKKKFKDLIFRLENSKEFHLSRIDRKLIALCGQTGAPIDTTDSGISEALAKLKISSNPWKKYFVNFDMPEKKDSSQLDFDDDDGE